MSHSPRDHRLRDDAIAIWQAGVAAVDAESLVRSVVSVEDGALRIAGETLPLDRLGRIVVVGAGKAGAGMACGFEQAIGTDILNDKVSGWVNVPADCVRPLAKIHLHPARPAGINEPTDEGVAGAEEILRLVSKLTADDVCIVLLSGGGSALLPAPVEGVMLADMQVVTRALMQAGARIDELNCVRKHLSRIKGGRLAQACGAGAIIALIISDVIGDPLDVIASGPTVADSTTKADALAVLRKFASRMLAIPTRVMAHLERVGPEHDNGYVTSAARVRNVVIGNIDIALRAAGEEAGRRGYEVQSLGGANAGIARDVGRALAEQCLAVHESHAHEVHQSPLCLLSGGEPIVQLVETTEPRRGGRNQELILAAAERLWDEDVSCLVLLSGGTDGEDGPTDAAGAVLDQSVLEAAHQLGLHPSESLATNNSYPFFELTGGHLKTGPTHTNVMDLRVCLIE